MAKKRKKDKEPQEEYEFRPPDFDEKEFLRKEMRDIRASLLTIVFAVMFGALAGVIAIASPDFALVGLIIVIAGMVALPTIYRFVKVDTSSFQKKNWAGNFGTFFFTFLAIWVMLMNPPFSDHAQPTIEEVIVWIDHDGTVTSLEYVYLKQANFTGYSWIAPNTTWPAATVHVSATDTVNITAKIADNGKLRTAEIAFDTQSAPFSAMTDEDDNRFGFKVAGDYSTTWSVYFRAVDAAGNVEMYHPTTAPPLTSL
ncbi:MAG: hypothetical protein MUC90_03100 [Thermoplasmata archaeon]|jgi:hypothetical protein|nr:hypothetical protein [Thermoplasmata archaeon]